MKSLIQAINEAEQQQVAIGHFNISTVDTFWGIVQAAKSLSVPVVIGVSEGEREFIGLRQTAAIVKSYRDSYSQPVYLNADHTFSMEKIKQVVETDGFDSVIFDGAKLSHEENTQKTKEVVDYVKSVKPDMLVEAEIGYIGTSSALLDEIPKDATVDESAMPTSESASDFVQATGVDLISPAVGNIHGMLKSLPNPQLNIDRIRDIRQLGGVPLVLHGGSGISDQNLTDAIKAGISMVHINTEIRLAWRDAVKQHLDQNPDDVAPYKILKPAVTAVQSVVESRLKLFNHIS